MMSGILSPAFLQAAGRAGKEKFSGIKLFTLATDPEISSITGTDLVIKTIKGGVSHEDTYSSLEDDTLLISADKDTEIIITGTITECAIGGNTIYSRISVKNTALTSLNCSDCSALQELNLSTNTALTSLNCSYCYALQELNLSTNTALTSLECSSCSALQELNLSTNTALTSLECGSCAKLVSISYPATNSNVSTAVAGAITAATAADGTVYTDSAGAYYSTIETAANNKGWTIEQL